MLWERIRNPGEGVSSGEEREKVVQIESNEAEINNKCLGCLKALKKNIVYVYLKIHFIIYVCIFSNGVILHKVIVLSLKMIDSLTKTPVLSIGSFLLVVFFSELEDKTLFLKTPYTLDQRRRGTEQELFCKSPPWCVAFIVLGGAM